MPAKQTDTFQSIMASLKARQYLPVYILMGDESYYIDKISDYIADTVLKPEERDFNQTICFGSDITAAQVADIARRYPMMADHQVVIVKEAQNIRSLEALETYLKNPVKSTILVWCYKNGRIDARKKVVTLAKAVGLVFDSQKLKEKNLPDFIVNYLKQHGTSIDNKACQMIADFVGPDLNRLTSELDKLVVTLDGDKMRVTPELVETKIGISKEFNTYELLNAVIGKDIYKANLIIKYFYKLKKTDWFYISVPLLFNYFQNLMIAHYSPNKSPEGIAQQLGLNQVWRANDFIKGMRTYSPRKVMEILAKIREVDVKSKSVSGVNGTPGELMKELIHFILH